MRKISDFQRILSVLFIGLFLAACFGQAQETSALRLKTKNKALIAELEGVIPQLMEKANIPGLSIAFIRKGKIIWNKGFGVKNAKTGEPVTEETIFEAASLTKPFFAYAVLRMVDEGLLDLDTPLIKYIPQEKIEEGLQHPMDYEGFRSDWFRKITARHVLSHSSGMPHGERGKPYPLFFEPGEKYKYSAQGYWYLQNVVEHLKGKKLKELMKDYVLDPLEMKDSCMVWRDEYETQSASGHGMLSESREFRKRTRSHAAASLYTTAGDYARFVIAVMNGTGLKKETAKMMLVPQVEVDKDIYWSLGFGVQRFPEGDAFWQWGDYGIFRNYIIAFKKHKLGVVYFTNSFNGLSIGNEIVKGALVIKDLAIAFLGYDQYDSPTMVFAQTVIKQGIDKARKMFLEFKEKYPPDEVERGINMLGYAFLNAGKYDDAIALFNLNVEHFPQSANVYDSLAEAYMKSGNDKLAIKYYRKTLDAIPHDPRADKDFLERLKKGAQDNLKKLEKKDELEVSAEGVTLYVKIAGNAKSGNVLIAINGGPGQSSRYMVSLEQLSSPEFAVVTYDQRGTGRSTTPSDGYALLKYVADLEAVRKAVGIEKVHILGHSWGGIVAMRYATVHPQHVRSLILMGSGPPSRMVAQAGQASLGQRIQELQRQGLIPVELPTNVGELLEAILPAYFSDPNFKIPDELKETPYSVDVYQQTLSTLGNWDFMSEVSELDHRVLMLWGQDDPFGLPMAEATKNAFSEAQVEFVILKGCGHFWHENADEFFSRIRTFLKLPSSNA
ncbi:MAG: alpha/beta fold hydrolase [Candidatus Aminicenantes bacterium]|nr:alpha/beta fold hydrolase [Candidatus Aminicenantes bacterium]